MQTGTPSGQTRGKSVTLCYETRIDKFPVGDLCIFRMPIRKSIKQTEGRPQPQDVPPDAQLLLAAAMKRWFLPHLPPRTDIQKPPHQISRFCSRLCTGKVVIRLPIIQARILPFEELHDSCRRCVSVVAWNLEACHSGSIPL